MAGRLNTLSVIFGLLHALLPSASATPPALQTKKSKFDFFDYNCAHVVFKADHVRLHVNDACSALKNSPELSQYPAYFKEDHLFGEEYVGRLLSWPLKWKKSRYQKGNPGNFRIIITTSCQLVAVVTTSGPRNGIGNFQVIPCPQFIMVGSQSSPVPKGDEAINKLDRYRCGDLVMFERKFALVLADRGCKVGTTKQNLMTVTQDNKIFPAEDLWMYPEESRRQNIGHNELNYYGVVFDDKCNLYGMIYKEGGNYKRCTEAKIINLDPDRPVKRLNDEYAKMTLPGVKTSISCAGHTLSRQAIIDNLDVAKSLLEEKLRNPAEGSDYPMITREGRVWLWPIRMQEESISERKRKHKFFMLGIDFHGKMVGLYFTHSRRPDIRKYTLCSKIEPSEDSKDSEVTLELPTVIHNLDSEEE